MDYEPQSMIFGPDGEELELNEKKFRGKPVSLTDALKSRRLKISSVKVGKIFLEKGVFKLHERLSDKTGEIKYYKKISDDYIVYGKNKKGFNGQTTPLFYMDNFLDLCLQTGLIE